MLEILGNIIYSAALLVIGAFINRFFESNPKLITYYGHVAAGKQIAAVARGAVSANKNRAIFAN